MLPLEFHLASNTEALWSVDKDMIIERTRALLVPQATPRGEG